MSIWGGGKTFGDTKLGQTVTSDSFLQGAGNLAQYGAKTYIDSLANKKVQDMNFAELELKRILDASASRGDKNPNTQPIQDRSIEKYLVIGGIVIVMVILILKFKK